MQKANRMQTKQPALWVTVLVAVVLIVAACAPRVGGGTTLDLAGSEDLAVDLPSVVIDFDENGTPSIGELALARFTEQFAPGLLDSLALSPEVVQFMVDSNVQHIQVSNSPEGVILLVNGKAMPSLKWDGETLQNTAVALDLVGVDIGPATATLERLLPVVTRLGVGAVMRFPVPDNVEAIALIDTSGNESEQGGMGAPGALLAAVDSPPTITIPIYYDAQGSWRVGDLTDAEWINLTGMPIFDSIRLRPEAVAQIMQQGISELTLATDTDGIHLSINGMDLPYIGWADGELNNALALGEEMGIWDSLANQNMNVDEVIAMVETLLPVVQATEITLTAHFPQAVALSQ